MTGLAYIFMRELKEIIFFTGQGRPTVGALLYDITVFSVISEI
tara:strand:- start:328 stop:456 length:129 start_codon:yes stop_codon:yes gene_type:complete